jgi:hypothetical protein
MNVLDSDAPVEKFNVVILDKLNGISSVNVIPSPPVRLTGEFTAALVMGLPWASVQFS